MKLRKTNNYLKQPYSDSFMLRELIERINENSTNKKYKKLKTKLISSWNPDFFNLMKERRKERLKMIIHFGLDSFVFDRCEYVLKAYGIYNYLLAIRGTIGLTLCNVDEIQNRLNEVKEFAMNNFENFDRTFQYQIPDCFLEV